jgi:hypothetical protein
MTEREKAQAAAALEVCDKEDRSTEYTIQFIADTVGVGYMEVLDWMVEGDEP